MKKIPIALFDALLISLLATLLLVACSRSEKETSGPENTSESSVESPDQESWESTIIVSKFGRRVAKIWAGYIAVYTNKNQTFLKDSLHVDFYDHTGKHKSVLTSREGVVDNRTENLKAIGNVIVVSDSGIVLETEELIWDNEKQKIISELPVKFTTETDTLTGSSFISEPDLSNYEIRGARGYSKRTIPLGK